MNILTVIGGTGNVGQHIVQRLAEEGSYIVRVVTRDCASDSARHLSQPPGVELVQGDIKHPDSLRAALDGAKRVFVALPQMLTSEEMVSVGCGIVDECVRCKVNTLVRLSSFGIDEKSAKCACTQGALGDAHVKIETYAHRKGLNVVSIRPTSFFTNFSAYDLPSIKDGAMFSSPLGVVPRVNWVSPEDIGAVAAACLCDPCGDSRVLDVTGGPENSLSARDMVDMLSSLAQRSITYKESATPPVRDYAALWSFLREGGFDHSTDIVEKVTGKKPQPFKLWLKSLDLSEKAI